MDSEWIRSKILNLTKDISYSAILTFKKLKWTGSSNQANFKLSSSTVLNLDQNSSSLYDNIIAQIGQFSIKDLYNFVTNGSSLPLTGGNKIAIEAVNNLLNMSESLAEFYKEVSNKNNVTDGLFNESANGSSLTKASVTSIDETIKLFSNTYSFLNLLKSILKAGTKNFITDKIYVTSNVKQIQVFFCIYFSISFVFLFFLLFSVRYFGFYLLKFFFFRLLLMFQLK